MKKDYLVPIAQFCLFSSFVLMFIIVFFPLPNSFKQILFLIAPTLFGISLVSILLSVNWNLKKEDYDYFRTIMIGIAGGLAVWIFSTIDFRFSNGFWIGINDILLKLGFSLAVIYQGYKFLRKK